MAWAREHGYVVVTHDLDFLALLAATRAISPSVIQMRTQDVLPNALQRVLIHAIKPFNHQFEEGTQILADLQRAKARVLPFE